MLRILLLALIFALAGAAPAKQTVVVKPFLWSVKGPGSKDTSYLLGTVHIGVSAKEMPEVVWKALRKSTTFVSEADVSSIDVGKIQKYLYYKPPQTLTKALGDKKAKTVAKALGTTVDAIQGMRPWFASSLMILKLEPNASAMLDSELQKAATRLKAKLAFLESYDEQMQMLAGLDDKLMMESLYAIASDLEKARAEYGQMTKLYRAGDDKGLAAFMEKEMAKVAGMEAEILQKRNANWIPKLMKHFAEGPTFVAVGAAHLVGNGSVVERLRKSGYVVKRLP